MIARIRNILMVVNTSRLGLLFAAINLSMFCYLLYESIGVERGKSDFNNAPILEQVFICLNLPAILIASVPFLMFGYGESNTWWVTYTYNTVIFIFMAMQWWLIGNGIEKLFRMTRKKEIE